MGRKKRRSRSKKQKAKGGCLFGIITVLIFPFAVLAEVLKRISRYCNGMLAINPLLSIKCM